MTAKLFTLPKQVQLTNSGALIPGGKAFFYINGTSTFQNTYTTLGMTTAHTNPVIADGNGKFPAIYLDASLQYKVKLTDASGVELYSEDNFTNPLSWGWPQTALEIANGISVVDEQEEPGNVFRYGAIADSSLGVAGVDNATAFQNAIDSGHAVYVPEGYYSIESKLLILSDGATQGGKTFIMSSNTRLERFGASTDPILHIVGSQNYVNGGIIACRVANTFAKGLVLFGNDPDETDHTVNTIVRTQGNYVGNMKIIGKSSNTGWDGSVGLYCDSPGRFRGDFITSPTPSYYNYFEDINVQQFDYNFFLGTDFNANTFSGCTSLTWGHSAFWVNGYGNTFTGLQSESATAQDTTERFTVHFGAKDSGPESGCDKDVATVGITGMTAASPCVVTCDAAHGLTTEDTVKLSGVTDTGAGTLESAVNGAACQVIVLSSTTFSFPLDTTALAPYSSGGSVSLDLYPILGAKNNTMEGWTENAFSGATLNVRLMGYDTPLVYYDVTDSEATYGSNDVHIIGSQSGGVAASGNTNETSIGTNHVRSAAVDVQYNKVINYHNFQFRDLDDNSGHTFGTDEYKILSGRLANLVESTAYNILTVDNVGPNAAGMILKLSFCGKEGANNDVHGGEISWILPTTADTNRTAVKFKDFQGNENDEQVTWSITDAAGTIANTGKYTLVLTTGSTAGTGEFFYTWKVELVTAELKGTGIDWDADITVQNGA